MMHAGLALQTLLQATEDFLSFLGVTPFGRHGDRCNCNGKLVVHAMG